MKMRLERRAASLIPGRKVSWGSSYGPGCGASVLPRTARSPVAFAGWNTTSELTEVGDFSEMACQIFLYSTLWRENLLWGTALLDAPFLEVGSKGLEPGNFTLRS